MPVLDNTVDQVVPPSDDLSISYPVTKTPLLLGAFQFRLICDEDTALAVRPVGDGNTGSIGLSGIAGTGTGGGEITGIVTGVGVDGNMLPSPEVVVVRVCVSEPS